MYHTNISHLLHILGRVHTGQGTPVPRVLQQEVYYTATTLQLNNAPQHVQQQ